MVEAGWYQTHNGPAFWDGNRWATPPGKMVTDPNVILPGWHPTEQGVLWWTGTAWQKEAPIPPPPPATTQPDVATPATGGAAPPRGFGEAIKVCLTQKYATFSGRASRSEFWFFSLGIIAFSFVLGFFLGFVGFTVAEAELVGAAIFFATLIPQIAVGVRRVHDLGQHGVFAFIPIVNLIMFLLPGQQQANKYDQT